MIAYKVVNKRNRSLIMDYLMFPVKHRINKYSIKYFIGKIAVAKKETLGIFLCTTLEEAKRWIDYPDKKILKVEILDKPYKPKYIHFSTDWENWKKSDYLKTLPNNTICSYKIKVLEEVK